MTSAIDFSRGSVDRLYRDHFASVPDKGMGWSFMYCPERRLHSAKIGLIGLNPGADREESTAQSAQADWDWTEGGMAYLDQPWGADGSLNQLQQQIKLMLDALSVDGEDVFAAQLVPFRSRSWASLPNRDAAVEACRPLWEHIGKSSPSIKLWISLGKGAGRALAKILGASEPERMDVGWGRQFAEFYQATDGRAVLALPHLSRFKLFASADTSAILSTLARVKERTGIA